MRPARIAAAALATALALATAGCSLGPGRPTGARSGPSAARADGPGGTLQVPPGIYLASFIALDVLSQGGLPIVVGPQVSTFPAGPIQFYVVNKWGGLAPGPHREELEVIAPGGQVLARDHTDFEIRPDQMSLTIASPLAFAAPTPGYYTVAVRLDGREVARYRFRVREAAAAPGPNVPPPGSAPAPFPGAGGSGA